MIAAGLLVWPYSVAPNHSAYRHAGRFPGGALLTFLVRPGNTSRSIA